MGKQYKWERRDKKIAKRGQHKVHNRRFLEIVGNAQEKASKEREKDRERILGTINKMLMKQTPLETVSGKNLPTIQPQQLAKVTGEPVPQAAQQIQRQQVANRQAGQMKAGKAPDQKTFDDIIIQQQPPTQAQRAVSFTADGADLVPSDIQRRMEKFSVYEPHKKAFVAGTLDINNPKDYQMAKYLARNSDDMKVQSIALNKLTVDDLKGLVPNNHPNANFVSILARKTQDPTDIQKLLDHVSPQVRANLLRNPVVTDNQDSLHMLISDKDPKIREQLVDKLDADGLRIMTTDKDPRIRELAKNRLDNISKAKSVDGKRTVFIPAKEDDIDSNLTVASQQPLPKYGYGTPVGSIGSHGGTQPSFSNKSLLLKEIDDFIDKAEGDVSYQPLTLNQLKQEEREWSNWVKQTHPELDINNPQAAEESPLNARVLKPLFYLRSIIQEFPELKPREQSYVTGAFKNGKLEGVSFLKHQGPYNLHLHYLISHPKNGDVNNPDRVKGIGTGLARRNIEIGSNSGRTLTIQPSRHSEAFWNRIKPIENNMVTIRPKEYNDVMAKFQMPETPKIENDMDDEFTSYTEPIRKDKIMKEFGMVADTYTPTFGGTEGQYYRNKIKKNLKFKSLDPIFDMIKSVGEEFYSEE